MKHRNRIFLAGLIIVSVVIVFFIQRSHQTNNIAHPINQSEDDIIIGKSNSDNTLFVFYNYNCSHCQRFFNDFNLFSNDTILNELNLKIVLKPLATSLSDEEYYALQTLIGLNLHGDPNKLHQLFLHNYNIIYRKEFLELSEIYINDNPGFAEHLFNNKEYQNLKSNLLQFNLNKFNATPTFIINNRKFKGYKNKKSFIEIINKQLSLCVQNDL